MSAKKYFSPILRRKFLRPLQPGGRVHSLESLSVIDDGIVAAPQAVLRLLNFQSGDYR